MDLGMTMAGFLRGLWCVVGTSVCAQTLQEAPAHFLLEGTDFAARVLRMSISARNVPSYWFEEGVWSEAPSASSRLPAKNKSTPGVPRRVTRALPRVKPDVFVFGNEHETVFWGQLNTIEHARYVVHRAVHPLDAHAHERYYEPLLKRFHFYCLEGRTPITSVSLCLFALDVSTRLIWAYALPSQVEMVWGTRIPRAWIPLEMHSHVRARYPKAKFYQFDPIGFVDSEGKVVLYPWALEQHAQRPQDFLVYEPQQGDWEQVASQTGPGHSPHRAM
ncbi:hypothetical protein [Treponema pallidum]|uniref:hypothetical protein n=2 Tax=Treponema pallidum TaxID=160 RepID=UPI00193A4C39|nr:hypothetical protein [Treponema pallidum]WGK74036.1 hypothetical protein TPE19LM_0629 [Treponema pallidum subsp. pertenue]WGK75009.1 hypothetical protein TPE22LM_0629 [Treponema pallidum subsp. pertenue]